MIKIKAQRGTNELSLPIVPTETEPGQSRV